MDKEKNNPSEQEKLISELEDLRALVEKTLKEESEKAESGKKESSFNEEFFIQDLEDVEVPESYKEKEAPLCICCDKKLSKKEIDSGKEYCDECYSRMKRRPLKMKGILTALIMAAVFFATAFTSMDSVMDYESADSTEYEYFFEGYVDYGEHRLISAEANYRKYLSERQYNENVSENAIRQLIDIYCTLGEYPYAVQIIEKYYSDFELSMPWNQKYREIIEKNDAYYDVYVELQSILEANYSKDGLDYEKTVSDIYALKEKHGSEAEYIIDIYAVRYSAYTEKDNKAIYEKLIELDEKYGKEESMHISLLCHYASIEGDKAKVDECFERIMKINSQDMSIYVACFNYYRYLETPDTEKMYEICNKMAELSGELANYGYYNCDYLYYLAISYMVKGDAGESSFKMMQELYDTINYYGEYYKGNSGIRNIFNLYALTALYTGNTEAYEWAKNEIEYLGFELSDLVEKYRSGEMTLAEIIADKGGDIA